MAIVITPLKLADMRQGEAITENWGRPTAFGQRWWNTNNRNIETSINGLQAVIAELEVVIAELEAQQAELEAQQAELEAQQLQIEGILNDLIDIVNQQADILDELAAQQATLEDVVAELDDTVDFLAFYVNYVDTQIRGYINMWVPGGAVASGQITATTSTSPPGYINITHGGSAAPDAGAVNVQMQGTLPYCVNIASYDSTTIAAYVWDPTTGAGVNGVSVTLEWNMWYWASLPNIPIP